MSLLTKAAKIIVISMTSEVIPDYNRLVRRVDHSVSHWHQVMTNGPRRLGFLLALILTLFGTHTASAQEGQKKKVLVFYPDKENSPGNLAFDLELRQLLHGPRHDVEIFNEFLDASRFPSEEYQRQLATFLRDKYAAHHIDVVVVGLAPSLDFVLKFRTTICPGVPVVYGAIEQNEVKSRSIPPDVIGIPMTFALEPTLQLALKLQPHIKKVYVIAGTSPFDQHWLDQARLLFQPYANRMEFHYVSDLSLNELKGFVASLTPDSIIYYLHMLRDKSGTRFSSAEVVGQLAPLSNVAIYGHVGTYLGRGIVGGQLMEFEHEARNAGHLVLQLLDGRKPNEVTLPMPAPTHYTADWRQLKQWGIPQADLPQGTILKFVEPTFWDSYQWHVLSFIALCIGEGLLILGLLLQRHNRQKAERLFRLSVDAAPNGMALISHEGLILLANPPMVRMFGYSHAELIGAPIEMLVPDRYREHHAFLRKDYMKAPETRLLAVDREFHGKRKDGTEFPVEIGLTPIHTDAHTRVLATVIDMSERRRAEQTISVSQAELIALTGRMMQAQESERRHIARELHDDLNQNLALLAVELDLLNKTPPESKGQLSECLTKLSSQVKELSTFVHDLSHQLHPAKIEQLGLVTALRGLCRDLGASHNLIIDFTADEMSIPIPQAVGLCLYRIAQEGLRNAIKHSKADGLEVKLRQCGDELVMSIADNGSGFDIANQQEHAGLGLISIRERLRLVDGALQIESKPDEGTRIEVKVPLHQSACQQHQNVSTIVVEK